MFCLDDMRANFERRTQTGLEVRVTMRVARVWHHDRVLAYRMVGICRILKYKVLRLYVTRACMDHPETETGTL